MYFKLYYNYSQEAFIYKCEKVSTSNKLFHTLEGDSLESVI